MGEALLVKVFFFYDFGGKLLLKMVFNNLFKCFKLNRHKFYFFISKRAQEHQYFVYLCGTTFLDHFLFVRFFQA